MGFIASAFLSPFAFGFLAARAKYVVPRPIVRLLIIFQLAMDLWNRLDVWSGGPPSDRVIWRGDVRLSLLIFPTERNWEF